MLNINESLLKKQLTRFFVVGCSAVITDFTVYFVLLSTIPHPTAKVLSFITGTIVAYIFNKYWTFEKTFHSNYQLITFFTLYAVTLMANVGVNTIVLSILPQYILLAFLSATCTSTILNFVGQKWWVFTDRHDLFFMKIKNYLMVKILKKYLKEWRVMTLFLLPTLLILTYLNFQFTNIGFLQLHSIDEYVFHGSLRHMYEGVMSADIRALFGFGFYQYGFAFFFLNLLATIPPFFTNNTVLALAAPRIITSLFALGSLVIIYFISRRYTTTFPAFLVVSAIIAMPAFWFNATWFHPDWPMTFFLLGFVLFLMKDEFSYQRNFYIAVLFYALAITFKYQAITFMPLLLLYIFYDEARRMSVVNAFKKTKLLLGSLFSIIIIFVITNPYILHPTGWKVFSSSFLNNMESNATNHGSAASVTLLDKVDLVISDFFMPTLFFIGLVGAATYLSMKYFADNKRNIHTILALNFLINVSYLLLFVNKAWQHYYLPVIILGILTLLFFTKQIRHQVLVYTLIIIVFTQGVFFAQSYKPILFESRDRINAPDFNTYAHQENIEINTFILESLDTIIQPGENVLITAYTPFEYEKLDIEFEDVKIIFGAPSKRNIDQDAYIAAQKQYWGDIKSKAEIATSFKPISYIVLRKDVPFIDTSKIDLVGNKEAYRKGAKLVDQLYAQEIGYTVLSENEHIVIFTYTNDKSI